MSRKPGETTLELEHLKNAIFKCIQVRAKGWCLHEAADWSKEGKEDQQRRDFQEGGQEDAGQEGLGEEFGFLPQEWSLC